MMDVKLINHAFLQGLIVKVWRADELMGFGKVVLHTRDTIKLDDGMYYYKDMFNIQIEFEQ